MALSPQNTARLQAAAESSELQALRKQLAALEGAARTPAEQSLLDTNNASKAARKAAPSAPKVTSPFGPSNFAISEKDGIVTIQLKLGINLGPTSSEQKRLDEGKAPLGTYSVARGDTSFKASDGTRFSFAAYNKS